MTIIAVWRMFADPTSRQLYKPKWEQVAQNVLAGFRNVVVVIDKR